MKIFLYKKTLFFIILMFLINVGCEKNEDDEVIEEPTLTHGEFTDNRDNKTYKWIKVNTTTWMAENLAFLPLDLNKSVLIYGYDRANYEQAKNLNNYKTYGCLYTWSAAKEYCPEGWRLPTLNEWKELVEYLGGKYVAGEKLKEVGNSHWASPNPATDEIGFKALPGGYGSAKANNQFEFGEIRNHCTFWADANESDMNASGLHIWNHQNMAHYGAGYKQYRYSVRCVKITF